MVIFLYLLSKYLFILNIFNSVLRYQTKNKKNVVLIVMKIPVNNIIKIVNTYLLNKTRPEKFRRDYKFLKTIKDDNPIIGINNSVKCH